MPSAALYARVSTVKQAQKDLSVPDQLRQMRDWCLANGYTVTQEYLVRISEHRDRSFR